MILLELPYGGKNIVVSFTDISAIRESMPGMTSVITMNSGKEFLVSRSYQEILKEITSFGAKKVSIDKSGEK